MTNRTFVFDVDNTLFDSMTIVKECYRDALYAVAGNGVELDPRTYAALDFGASWDAAWPLTSILTEDVAVKVHQYKHEIYIKILGLVRPHQAVLDLMVDLKALGRIVLWTNAKRDVVIKLLDSVGLLSDDFVLLTRETFRNPKPSVNGLVEYLDSNQVPLSRVCVFDDSPTVINNLRDAGLTGLLVVHPFR